MGIGLQLVQSVDAGHFDEATDASDGAQPQPDRWVGIERDAAIRCQRHVGEAGDIGDRGMVRCQEAHATKLLFEETGFQLAHEVFGYDRNGIGPFAAARIGARFTGGFAYVDAVGDALYNSAGLDSGSVQLAGTVVLQPAARHVAVMHLEGGWLQDPLPGEEFDLGLGTGPRAFGSHAFTGDRSFFATAEYRYTVVDDLWGLVGLGVAGFVDHGGAWYSGSPRRVGGDAGVGLRLGARRFANDAEPGAWVLTVGKGFVFSTPTRGFN